MKASEIIDKRVSEAALLSVLSGATSSLVFVGTMAIAMLLFESARSEGDG